MTDLTPGEKITAENVHRLRAGDEIRHERGIAGAFSSLSESHIYMARPGLPLIGDRLFAFTFISRPTPAPEKTPPPPGGEGEPYHDGPIGNGQFAYRTTLTGERHLVETATGFVRVALPYNYRHTSNAQQRRDAERIVAALTTTPAGPDYAKHGKEMEEALRGAVDLHDVNTCLHEDTHRGGRIWTICDDCGRKWADDEGGKPAHKDPAPISRARAILSKLKDEPTLASTGANP